MTILSVFKKNVELTLNIAEKATRRDFWVFHGVNFLIQAMLVWMWAISYQTDFDSLMKILSVLYLIFLFIGTVTIGLRRLNELNISKYWMFLCLIPVLNSFFYYLFLGFWSSNKIEIIESNQP